MTRMQRPPTSPIDRFRTVPQARAVDYLAHIGGCFGDHRPEAQSALDELTRHGLPFARGDDGERRFDPAEVLNFLKWTGNADPGSYWEHRVVPNYRACVRDFHPAVAENAVPPPPAVLAPKRFTVSLRREFDPRYLVQGAPIVLRLPLPIEDDALTDLALDCAPMQPGVQARQGSGRLDVKFPAAPKDTVVLGASMTFTARPATPRAQALSREERDLYTRTNEDFVRVTPRIADLASAVAGIDRDPWRIVHRFHDYLLDQLTCGAVAYETLDPADPLGSVLDGGWFDCQLGAALVAAMCRSKGIPARMAGGYAVYPSLPFTHWWLEAWVDDRGWVPIDTFCCDLSALGRDTAWRDYFLGGIDYRMKAELLPRLFSRSPGVRIPPAWRLLTWPEGEETHIAILDAATGAPVYRDRIVVRAIS